MMEQIILGIVQGIAEWLPVSSEGLLVLIKTNFFAGAGMEGLIKQALFLHLGTFLAALFYFRKDVGAFLKTLISYRSADQKKKKLFNFLLISTIITGLLGYSLLKLFVGLESHLELTGKIITLLIGLLLIVNAFFQLKAKNQGFKQIRDLKIGDSVLLGMMQGLAVLPGLSRSGLTVSSLLLKRFDETVALKLSFLMSLPVVLAGNIILNWRAFAFSWESFLGLVFSFIFGLLTISLLLRLARKINFGWFVLIFGGLVLASAFV
ncbi:MAG: undecaprenyl-diphosphate phosphatase [Patescibacteria group bacterium]